MSAARRAGEFVQEYLEDSVARKHYRKACRYLRRMVKLGGRKKVDDGITLLRKKYPRRVTLMDELDMV